MSYDYDIFISYTRGGHAGEWVRNHFQPQLKGWLDQTMDRHPAIFWDPDIQPGEQWPATLRHALAHSRIIVPVLNAPYFRSEWCLAELNTMIARAAVLADADVTPRQLIQPVRFAGEDFPEPIPSLQYKDMEEWAYPGLVFQQTVQWLAFVDAVRDFARSIKAVLATSPPWAPDWPVRTPPPPALTEIELVRL